MNTREMQHQRTKATSTQLNYLVEYMKKKSEYTSGHDNSLQMKVKLEKMWQQLAATLNSLGGPVKSIEKWKQTWRDIRNKEKKKTIKNVAIFGMEGVHCTRPVDDAPSKLVAVPIDTIPVHMSPLCSKGEVQRETEHATPSLPTPQITPPVLKKPSPRQQKAPQLLKKRMRFKRRFTTPTETFNSQILEFEKEQLEVKKIHLLLKEKNMELKQKNLEIKEAKVKALERIAAALEHHNLRRK